MSRRVRERGFSAQADFPSNWRTRERILSMLSAMIKRVVRAAAVQHQVFESGLFHDVLL
jgi:hypothetical protein